MIKRSTFTPGATLVLVAAFFSPELLPAHADQATTPAQTKDEKTIAPKPAPPATQTTPRRRARRVETSAGSTAETEAADDDAPKTADDPTPEGVLAAFDALVAGIERSDVDAVMALYWNSPQLTIYNNNGTVTRGWDQLHANRASAYPYAKNVKLDARRRNVHMLGREGAIVTCQWTQTQTARGIEESAAGRLTVVFRRVGASWKIVHTHTSPEVPDPSRLPKSERGDTPKETKPAPIEP